MAALAHSGVGSARYDVRHGIRAILTAAEGYHDLDEETRRIVAGALVRISSTALTLADDTGSPQKKPVLAMAQNAGDEFSGTAADRIAPITQSIMNAVSFPRFVGELITGVFKAMNDSNQQQLTAYVDLIRNVATTTEGFADSNVGISGARSWLAERFPTSFMIEGEEEDPFPDDPETLTPEERAERAAERDTTTRLILRPGASMPTQPALRTAFGIAEGESVPGGSPENLVPFARASIARNRQQMLATMVSMGMQRIVIESGRLNASMQFHIDTHSAAQDDRGSTFDLRNTVEAGAKARFGPWGAEAKVQNTIGYVTTEQTQTTEEVNTDLDLNSSVELIFRTDYLPLDRLAGSGDVSRIRDNSINPEADVQRTVAARTARTSARATRDAARSSNLRQRLSTPAAPPRPTAVDPPEPPADAPAETTTPTREDTSEETTTASEGTSERTATPTTNPADAS